MLSGIINGLFSIRATVIAGGIFTIPTYQPVGLYAVSMLVAFVVALGLMVTLRLPEEQVVAVDGQDKSQSVNAQAADTPTTVMAPVGGKVISLGEVKDEVFASGKLGKGFAVVPDKDDLYAPVSGTVTALYPTQHAVGFTSDGGAEVLIHIGIDTVKLNGKGFHLNLKQGQHVNQGDLLGHADFDAIQKQGYDDTVIVALLNSGDFNDITIDLQNQSGDIMRIAR
ncbi:glucose PTS transporter subunit IIA [Lacticaseibacillus sp. 866-1]|uniref:PTS sugar transporter subunit IIA n=1 Tax=Lacticaseibacillus sp. 866-1 TaxID=2799576 RepID=UPI0019419527|nr:glucose PTS transporter subunit IIA [Lacticaseibacillus sp. 866-1]